MNKVLFALLITTFCQSVIGDIYVLANRNNPLSQVRLDDIRDFYLGRRLVINDREYALVYDRGEESRIREKFFNRIAGMPIRQVDAYWARLVFSGRMLPLSKVESNKELLERIGSQKNAIGYTDVKPQHPEIKVVLVISDE